MGLEVTGTNFDISMGIGLIALFGICIHNGALPILAFKQNLDKFKGENFSLFAVLKLGVNSRIRPVMMTALMAAVGLLPTALFHGIHLESSLLLVRLVIGDLLYAVIFSL